jgi:hypothetical protein
MLRWLMRTRGYRWVMMKVMPFARFSMGYSDIRGWKFARGYQLLHPGHIVLSVDRKKLNTLLIPGIFSHACLCVDGDLWSEWEISEMTHLNFTKSTFYDVCAEADRVVILECPDWDIAYVEKVIERCKSFEHVKYDIEFEPGLKNLYCSELVYEADFERRLKLPELKPTRLINRTLIPPDALYYAANVRVVWDSDAETGGRDFMLPERGSVPPFERLKQTARSEERQRLALVRSDEDPDGVFPPLDPA